MTGTTHSAEWQGDSQVPAANGSEAGGASTPDSVMGTDMPPVPYLHVESAGGGPPLVLLHGWALRAGLFTPLLPSLGQRFRVHAVDLPGHGQSEPVSPFTVDAVVALLERRFSAVAAPLRVLGWSMGGMIALQWALANPARIDRLVLVCTTPKYVADATWPHAIARETLERFGDELRAAYRLTLKRFLTLQVQGSDEGRATLAALRQALFAHGEPAPEVMAEALRLLEVTDLRSRVSAIGARALVIVGGRDTLTPPEAGEWLSRTMGSAGLLRIEGAGHAPFLSHRAAFVDAVIDFLADE